MDNQAIAIRHKDVCPRCAVWTSAILDVGLCGIPTQFYRTCYLRTFESICRYGEAGCKPCALFYATWQKDYYARSLPPVEALATTAQVVLESFRLADLYEGKNLTANDGGHFRLRIEDPMQRLVRIPTDMEFEFFWPRSRWDQRKIGALAEQPACTWSVETAPHASSSSCMVSIRKWMKECYEDHEWCNSLRTSPSLLPTRVIDVSFQNEWKAPRLVCSYEGQTGAYATLSHCWGHSDPLKLTKQNAHQFQRCIPMEALSKTFQDAIWITHHLGIRYLWIDCFGIMQDDHDDWLRESVQMHRIFGQSAVSLCSLSNSQTDKSNQGLLWRREGMTRVLEVPGRGLIGIRMAGIDLWTSLQI